MTKNKLNELNAKLQKLYIDGELGDYEKLFNLGVEFGRYYESNNLNVERTSFWDEKEKAEKKRNDEQKNLRNAQQKIEDFLQSLIVYAIDDFLKEEMSFTFAKRGTWGSNFSKFSDELVEKYSVRYADCDMENYEGSFELDFVAEGDLAKLLNENNISRNIHICLCNNSGEEYVSYSDARDFKEDIYSVSVNMSNSKLSAEELEEFLQTLSQPYTFIFVHKENDLAN